MRKSSLLLLAGVLLLAACDSSSGTGETDVVKVALGSATPVNPQVVELTATITKSANITISKVVFKRDGVEIKTDTSEPYSAQDYLETPGTYKYTATAYDNLNRTITGSVTLEAEFAVGVQSLSGTVVETASPAYPLTTTAWTGGAGTVILETADLTAPSEITRTALASDGTFALTLPVPTAAQLKTATPAHFAPTLSGCDSSQVTVSDTAAQVTLSTARTVATKNVRIAPTAFPPPSTTTGNQQVTYTYTGTLVYADRPVTLSGALVCPRTATQNTEVRFNNLALVKGWNKLTVQINKDSAGTVTEIAWAEKFPSASANIWLARTESRVLP